MKYLSIVFLILFAVTGCSSVALTRYDNDGAWIFFLDRHPVRPDICPKEHISSFIQYMPGDAVYFVYPTESLKHQRCNELYGGCTFYFINKNLFSDDEVGCIEHPDPYGEIDKETCLAKGGEWHDFLYPLLGIWCELPYI